MEKVGYGLQVDKLPSTTTTDEPRRVVVSMQHCYAGDPGSIPGQDRDSG